MKKIPSPTAVAFRETTKRATAIVAAAIGARMPTMLAGVVDSADGRVLLSCRGRRLIVGPRLVLPTERRSRRAPELPPDMRCGREAHAHWRVFCAAVAKGVA